MGDLGGGGLKRRVCQFVDWRFLPILSTLSVAEEGHSAHLKVIITSLVILVDGFRKYYQRVADEYVSNVFG